jgi:hypothetical protein
MSESSKKRRRVGVSMVEGIRSFDGPSAMGRAQAGSFLFAVRRQTWPKLCLRRQFWLNMILADERSFAALMSADNAAQQCVELSFEHVVKVWRGSLKKSLCLFDLLPCGLYL